MKPSNPVRLQRGFGLIEVLAALVVVAIGLLGIAKMQAMAIANTGMSARRTQAAIQASSLASAMHANKAYWGTMATAPANLTITKDSVIAGQPAQSCTVQSCSIPEMAAYDLQIWANQLQTMMPASTIVNIFCTQPVSQPVSCGITISWTENIVSMNNSAASGTNASTTYTLYVAP